MRSTIGWAIVAVTLIFGTYACGFAVRDAEVEQCRERGGRAITAPWYSENYFEVRCIEAGDQ